MRVRSRAVSRTVTAVIAAPTWLVIGSVWQKLTHNLCKAPPVTHTADMRIDAGHETAPAPAGLPVTAAARRLGVSASTLRSWERRYGLGPSLRTPGGHRRYSATDLAALQRLQQLIAAGRATATAARGVSPGATRGRPMPAPRESAGRLAGAVDGLDA